MVFTDRASDSDNVSRGQGEQAESQFVQEQEEDPCFTQEEHICGVCGRVYCWSAFDIEWQSEDSPFMPCGHRWQHLDTVFLEHSSQQVERTHQGKAGVL
jgi:hypothetical protein